MIGIALAHNTAPVTQGPQPTARTRYVVLRGIERSNVFYTSFDPKRDTAESIRFLANGELAYDVVAFCDSSEEAQRVWRRNYSCFLGTFR